MDERDRARADVLPTGGGWLAVASHMSVIVTALFTFGLLVLAFLALLEYKKANQEQRDANAIAIVNRLEDRDKQISNPYSNKDKPDHQLMSIFAHFDYRDNNKRYNVITIESAIEAAKRHLALFLNNDLSEQSDMNINKIAEGIAFNNVPVYLVRFGKE